MAAAYPVARSLLALACFALLGAGSAHSNRRQDVNNCAELLTGQTTAATRNLDPVNTPPYQIDNAISNSDHCASALCAAGNVPCARYAVGSLIKACDFYGTYPPSITSVDIFTQLVHCNGPCYGGMTVTVTQYCNY